MPDPRKLTPKQELFIIEYSKDFNATQAAIRAGYSAKNANKIGPELLGKTRLIIEERKQERLKAGGGVPAPVRIDPIATLEQSLALATSLAFYDPRKLYDENGNRKPHHRLTRKQALCVVDVGAETDLYKTIDRAPYLNMLLKWHRAFADKEPPKPPEQVPDCSNWTTEDFEAYQKLKAKLTPTVIDAHGKSATS